MSLIPVTFTSTVAAFCWAFFSGSTSVAVIVGVPLAIVPCGFVLGRYCPLTKTVNPHIKTPRIRVYDIVRRNVFFTFLLLVIFSQFFGRLLALTTHFKA